MHSIFNFLSRWLARAGDYSFWSWVITFLYLIAISLSFYYVSRLKEKKEQRFLWICISIFLLAMGINKQLDFQTLLIMVGRRVSWRFGIYRYRSLIQKTAAVIILGGVSVLGVVILIRIRSVIKESLTALLGVTILVFFALVRVGSFTHVHRVISLVSHLFSRIHGLELLGLP